MPQPCQQGKCHIAQPQGSTALLGCSVHVEKIDNCDCALSRPFAGSRCLRLLPPSVSHWEDHVNGRHRVLSLEWAEALEIATAGDAPAIGPDRAITMAPATSNQHEARQARTPTHASRWPRLRFLQGARLTSNELAQRAGCNQWTEAPIANCPWGMGPLSGAACRGPWRHQRFLLKTRAGHWPYRQATTSAATRAKRSGPRSG
jgi:hypothetical protein